jgi:hypothetical protein
MNFIHHQLFPASEFLPLNLYAATITTPITGRSTATIRWQNAIRGFIEQPQKQSNNRTYCY